MRPLRLSFQMMTDLSVIFLEQSTVRGLRWRIFRYLPVEWGYAGCSRTFEAWRFPNSWTSIFCINVIIIFIRGIGAGPLQCISRTYQVSTLSFDRRWDFCSDNLARQISLLYQELRGGIGCSSETCVAPAFFPHSGNCALRVKIALICYRESDVFLEPVAFQVSWLNIVHNLKFRPLFDFDKWGGKSNHLRCFNTVCAGLTLITPLDMHWLDHNVPTVASRRCCAVRRQILWLDRGSLSWIA